MPVPHSSQVGCGFENRDTVPSRFVQPPPRPILRIESSAIHTSTAQRGSDYFKFKEEQTGRPDGVPGKNEATIRGGLKFQTGCEVRDNSEPRQPEWSKDGTLEPLGIHEIYQNRRHRF